MTKKQPNMFDAESFKRIRKALSAFDLKLTNTPEGIAVCAAGELDIEFKHMGYCRLYIRYATVDGNRLKETDPFNELEIVDLYGDANDPEHVDGTSVNEFVTQVIVNLVGDRIRRMVVRNGSARACIAEYVDTLFDAASGISNPCGGHCTEIFTSMQVLMNNGIVDRSKVARAIHRAEDKRIARIRALADKAMKLNADVFMAGVAKASAKQTKLALRHRRQVKPVVSNKPALITDADIDFSSMTAEEKRHIEHFLRYRESMRKEAVPCSRLIAGGTCYSIQDNEPTVGDNPAGFGYSGSLIEFDYLDCNGNRNGKFRRSRNVRCVGDLPELLRKHVDFQDNAVLVNHGFSPCDPLTEAQVAEITDGPVSR